MSTRIRVRSLLAIRISIDFLFYEGFSIEEVVHPIRTICGPGISCITNMAAGIKKEKISHDKILTFMKMNEEKANTILKEIIHKFSFYLGTKSKNEERHIRCLKQACLCSNPTFSMTVMTHHVTLNLFQGLFGY
ncbi:MAG: purine nucleoside phosphorylase [Candidatus Scalindua rubra]|uniref:Purine nucleoside phosphorylase n=1 Tax=Candidatus Scalindua rubra TaxID=1872076 RepID=A0A1E3XAD1_9BACT|nr:MAG: purine nucleoside phosphorylase [Candidatus Scalindua rubra]